MIWGLSTDTFTTVHVVISLIGIASGLVVLYGLLGNRWFARWNALFLATTIATSVTGFGFPFDHFLPSHKVGILSLVLLAIALVALYAFHLASAPGLEAIPAAGTADSERVTEDLLAAIARACPGKPVRFVVLSHHHSDHLGGVRAFADRGVTFLAAPGHVGAVRRALSAPHALAPDRWRGDGRESSVEAVPDRRVISDGRRRLEVINVGENPHTKENLFVWLPEERLLFQGDLFYYEEGEPFPPSGREIIDRFFAGWLSARGLSPKAVYGVHYTGAAPPEALALAGR
jgi:glyoxylase-like metal-dependent hydrolase (beta-lactamase superfamily II)